VKHRGAGASRSPARDAARAQGRAQTRRARSGAGTSGPAVAAAVASTPNWLLVEDEDTGALVAVHLPTGVRTVLATPPPEGER
jgi:hypothetical protein